MAEPALVARSPIPPVGPVSVVSGWEMGGRRSNAALTLVDCMALAKVSVRAAPDGAVSKWLGAPFGRAVRQAGGPLVTGSAPGEWTLFAPPGGATALVAEIQARAEHEGLVSVLDITHGRALMRIEGRSAPALLAKLCAVDLGDAVTPNGAAFRSSVAKVVTDVVRDDLRGTGLAGPQNDAGTGSAGPQNDAGTAVRSYLLHCERSHGAYLFGALLDAGAEHDIEVDGFASTIMRGV